MINSFIPKNKYNKKGFNYSKPLILITNLLFDLIADDESFYKNYFEESHSEILDSILNFCDKMIIKDKYIIEVKSKASL
jgi:hypothetical protein